jgi:hypothetical protein
MKKFSIAVFLVFYFGCLSYAQISKATLLTKNPVQYKLAEWKIDLTECWENPFLQEDISLDMFIISPSGKKLTLPCFFESGESGKKSVWKARFTAQETGRYTYCLRLFKSGKIKDTSEYKNFVVQSSNSNGFLHAKNNWILEFDNGKPFRGIGENLCWESRDIDDSKFYKQLHENPKYNYDSMLSSLAANGGNFYRTWMCKWNLPIDWRDDFNNKRYTSSDEYFNPSAIKRMDEMINLADSLGVYVMLTLGPGAYRIEDGGISSSAADFFANPKSKDKYKNRLRYIIARWGYSTSIAAWELFNEIDNVQFSNGDNPISADSITQWHDEMSTYLKQTDPFKHLVTTSISHRDVKGLNSLANIDFNQKHIYKNTSSIPSAIIQYEEQFKKPYVIGEFGYEWDWSKNFDDFAADMILDFKRGLWYGLFSPTPIIPMSWWWEFFDKKGMMPYFKGVREISDQMLIAGNGSFEVVGAEAGTLEAFGLTCGDEIFVYLFNNSSSQVKTDLIIKTKNNLLYNTKGFIPTTRTYNDLGVSSSDPQGVKVSNVVLDSKNELVLILQPKK